MYYHRCDSSHCLLCHGQQGTSQHVHDDLHQTQTTDLPSSPLSQEERFSSNSQEDENGASCGAEMAWQGTSAPGHPRHARAWFSTPSDALRSDPAPAELMEVAEVVLGPSQFVNALEFSAEGRLLVTGSCLKKEVRLYNLNGMLHDLQQYMGGCSCCDASSGGVCQPWLTASAPLPARLSHAHSPHQQQAVSHAAFGDPGGRTSTGLSDTPVGALLSDVSMLGGSSTAGTSSSTTSWWPAAGVPAADLQQQHQQQCGVLAGSDSACKQGWPSATGTCSSRCAEAGACSSRRCSPGISLPVPGPSAVHRLPSKVSCLSWSTGLAGVVCVGDYDGVITQLHLATGHQLQDLDGHGGKRIWGLAHSHPLHQPLLCASASEDGTARLWGGRGMDSCVAVIQPSTCSLQRTSSGGVARCASVCGVDWSPSPLQPHLLALACADHNAYVFDIRHTQRPLHVLQHHSRPVSYAKFFGPGQLVTASTDGSLAIWDLTAASSTTATVLGPACSTPSSTAGPAQLPHTSSHAGAAACPISSSSAPLPYGGTAAPPSVLQPWKVLRGHRNERSFVGLAVQAETGLVACGSESSCVYTYHRAWSSPLASADLLHAGGSSRAGRQVGSWQQPASLLPAWQQQTLLGSSRGSADCVLMQGGGGSMTGPAAGPAGSILRGQHAAPHRTSSDCGGTERLSNCGSRAGAAFVSSVAWQPAAAGAAVGLGPLLAAGTSAGTIRLLLLHRLPEGRAAGPL